MKYFYLHVTVRRESSAGMLGCWDALMDSSKYAVLKQSTFIHIAVYLSNNTVRFRNKNTNTV